VTTVSFDADCIVVGSGPAGVSAALPMLEAGRKVLMIDGARDEPGPLQEHEAPWRRMLGDRLEALLPSGGMSPKLDTPAARRAIEPFRRQGMVRGEGFAAIGAHARGGLSGIWGGFACEFDAEDVDGWPFPIAALRPSYKVVTERIGISGSRTDDLAEFHGLSGAIEPALPLGASASRIFERYRASPRSVDFVMGAARNAILTIDRDDRKACDLRKSCIWGCARGAIYDSRLDIPSLAKHRNFRLIDDALAIELRPFAEGWEILTQDGRHFHAPRILLAAGALATTALALPLVPNLATPLRLLSNPVLAMPLLLPSRLASAASLPGYSLAQLAYRLRYGASATDYATGALFEVDGLPASAFVARLPFSWRGGRAIFAALAPALLVATCNFPGNLSDNRLRMERQHGRNVLVIQGGFDATLSETVARASRRLGKVWRRLGAWRIPGAALAMPGADVHYAGPLAMGCAKAHGTTSFGEMLAAPGIFVADGAALPSLPSKYPTLTIMANADRIGRHLAERMSSG
jgi:choline dehydrogenase-like flavoprotein